MIMTVKAQKLGLTSRRHYKKLSAAKSMRRAKAQSLESRPLGAEGPFVIQSVSREIHERLYGKRILRGAGSRVTSVEVAAAEAAQVEGKPEVQVRAERLAMHRKAVSMITGMWKDREGGPVDGVEYQNKMREAW
ncbi:MAG: hypothetical protein WKG03_11085 [Telluria sp.]